MKQEEDEENRKRLGVSRWKIPGPEGRDSGDTILRAIDGKRLPKA